MPQYTDNKRKSKLARLKLVGKPPLAKLHLGPATASDDVPPGDYLAKCSSAWIEPWHGAWRVVWQFILQDGKHHGVGVRKWKIFDASGEVQLKSEYARACAIALKRPLDIDDDVNDPASIFAGKQFIVFVGYRKTEKPNGGRASDELALKKKDDGDKLKVHDIRSLVEP